MKKITLLLMLVLSWCSYAQGLPNEGFEVAADAFPPVGWATFQNEVGTGNVWKLNPQNNDNRPAHTGTGAAFIDRVNVGGSVNPIDYLATPSFVVPSAPQLRFWSRLTSGNDQGTTYRVMIKPVSAGAQDDPSGYIQLQQWTEQQINPVQEEYIQKVVSIPATYVSQSVYIAFVIINVNGGDRWLVDDVNVVTECLAPTTLVVANAGLTTADLSWANPSGATSFQIEIKPQAAAFDGITNIFTSTAASYQATGLTQGTDYKFRVRAVCSPGNESPWSTPVNFSTVSLGESCGAPIVVTLPYSTTGNTADYADLNYEGSPGTGCGSNFTYLGGNDVVYAYTATTTGVISIDLSGTAGYTGLFVYNSCANIGVSCTAGAVNSFDAQPISLPTVSVTAGTTYYIVISTWPSPQTTPYTLVVQAVNCPPPTGLTAINITSASAGLSWNANGSSSWEVVVQTPGAGIPAGAGTTVSSSTNYTVSQTTAGVAFTPATPYEYYVRAACPGSALFSAWAGPYAFMTTQIAAAVPYTQNFETAPSGFSLVNGTQENKWVVGTAVNNGGTTSLYVSNNNGVSNEYSSNAFNSSTVHAFRDIQMPVTVDQVNVSFDWRALGEGFFFGNIDYLRVWVVPASYVPAAGTQITAGDGRVQLGGDLLQSETWQTFNGVLNAATYSNQVARVVFEWHNDGFGNNQPPAAVDNINISVITCSAPSALTLGTVGETTANVSWTAPASGAASYDYYLSTSSTAPVAGTTPTGNVTPASAALTGLTDSTTYYVWVRSNCGDANGVSFWVGPLSFNTTQVAATLPYSQDFEGVSSGFTLNNGTQSNKWVVGTAVNNGGTHSLYISNDNGASNNYNSNQSVVHAYRDIAIPAGTTDVSLSFDWQAEGEGGIFSQYDYLNVWAVPVTFNPITGTQIQAGTDVLQITPLLYGNPDFTTATYIFNASAYSGNSMRLVFQWRNDTSVENQPPAAVDNISLAVVTCPQPATLAATNITSSQATLTWDEQGTAPAWEVYVATAGSPAPIATTTGQDAAAETYTATETTAGVAFTGLTNYVFYVRAVCSDDDKSLWSGPFAFQTAIGNNECAGAVTVPVNPSEACTAVTPVAFTGATTSAEANTCNTPNGGDVWYEFTATNDAHGININDFTGTPNPIGLALYEGDECGELIQLYCSYNNVINATNLVVDNIYKIRIYINQLNPNLNTAFDLCVNTPPPPANNNQNSCVINTINSSFEEPGPITGIYPPLLNHNVVPGWRTTAPDQMIEFWPTPNFENVPSYDGAQFIELNANVVAGVYQDFATPEITDFTYSFAHRARRNGIDVIQLLAGPPGGPYEEVGDPVASGNLAWTFNTGTYSSPEGQSVTRFIFQSVSTSGENGSVGNFLDAITFTANNGIISANPANVDCVNNIANIQAAGSGTWIAHSDNPAPTVIADASDNTTTISGFGPSGTYRYDWNTVTCISTLEIIYDGSNVAAPAVTSPVAYCVGEQAVQLSATPIDSNTLNWYTQATGGTASATAPTPSTTTATAPTGTTYYVSQTPANGCESQRAAITVIVNEIPAAPAVTDVVYCQNATAVPLTATAANNATVNWYTQATGGSAATDAPTPDTAVAGEYFYYVSQTSAAGCESEREQIKVTVNATITPVTAFTLPASICIASTGTLLPQPVDTANFTSGGTYTSTPANIVNSTTGQIDLSLAQAGQTYSVKYEILPDPAVCNIGGSSQVQISVNAQTLPETGFSYPAQVCANAASQMLLPNPGFIAGGMFSVNGGLSINQQTGEINFSNAAVGPYVITYTFLEDTANCVAGGSSQFTVNVTNAVVPVTQFDYDAAYCYDAANTFPQKDSGFTTGGIFTSSPEGLSIDAATGLINFGASNAGTYSITYTVQPDAATCNSGGSFTDTITVNGNIDFTLNGACEGSIYSITATPVDNSYNQDTVTYSWRTANGQTIGTDDNTLNVTDFAARNIAGNTFPVEITVSINNNGCTTSKAITVTDIGCTIQKGISPNNDGLNDNFELTSLNVRHLSIFNRYGTEVYSYRNYTNQWYGQTKSGDELPTGTYYYMIDRNNGEQHTGWIYINREE